MARVVISLVTWNSEKDVPACLAAMQKQTFSDLHLVIVDNASEDETRSVLSRVTRHMSNVHLISNGVNRGYAVAHNQAIRWATEHGAEFVLVLNPDVVLSADALAVLVRAMEVHTKAGSVGLPLVHEDGTVDSLGLEVRWGGQCAERGGHTSYTRVSHDERVLGVSGACALYRLSALTACAEIRDGSVDFFDETFFAYKEDVDVALRLRACGWESWITHATTARHGRAVADASRGSVVFQYRGRAERSERRSYLSYRNHLFLLRKHWKSMPVPKWQIVLYEFGKALYVLLREPQLLKAWKEFVL